MKELLGKDMRLTNQRRMILEELKSVTTHPTADEIYGMVRQKLPRISLGTVYRNLEVLSSLGLVRKLENAAGQKRFDGDVSPHHHIRCDTCGKVGDIFDAPDVSGIELGVSTDFQITGLSLEFSGICPQCLSAKRLAQ
ncbi:MAG: transcriptional repressor [Desulfomicrobium sp.]|nr:transcriptional repressor [Pseudomonadota bacterium]MBV1711278.1 transcriptional repressor [Desulfomicrobium sp.]MBU4569949.1 transcriptional repressor [Pseudomonadota bacterium]MBU4595048.1 transcriptional repressor [Pseudomonadota bacterium]MBV1720121.1 transcriptional repressor [Desulfomicrobium sp.]